MVNKPVVTYHSEDGRLFVVMTPKFTTIIDLMEGTSSIKETGYFNCLLNDERLRRKKLKETDNGKREE